MLNMKKYSNFIIVIICFLVITTISIGYSAMNTTLDIKQKATLSPDAVAKVGNKYYGSVQAAINSINSSSQSVVYLVKDGNETVTIPEDKDIVLNTDTFTLSSTEVTITNYGTLTILNSKVSSNGTSINVDNKTIPTTDTLSVTNDDLRREAVKKFIKDYYGDKGLPYEENKDEILN